MAGYVKDLMRLVFVEVFEDPANYVEELRKVPIPVSLSEQFDRPAKEDLIARHVQVQSSGGRKPTQFPPASGNSCRIRRTTHDGMTTRTCLPRYPQHQLTKLRQARYPKRLAEWWNNYIVSNAAFCIMFNKYFLYICVLHFQMSLQINFSNY